VRPLLVTVASIRTRRAVDGPIRRCSTRTSICCTSNCTAWHFRGAADQRRTGDLHFWVTDAPQPSFLRLAAPFYQGGPMWVVESLGPEIPSRRPVTSALRSLRSVLVTWRAGRFSETGFVQVGRHPGRITATRKFRGSGHAAESAQTSVLPTTRPGSRASTSACRHAGSRSTSVPINAPMFPPGLIGPPGQYFYNAAHDRGRFAEVLYRGRRIPPTHGASVRIASPCPTVRSGFVAVCLGRRI